VCDVFRRNERRKRRNERMRPLHAEIQGTKTEGKQPNHRWEGGHETMQIEREVHRRGGGMVMPVMRSLHRVDSICMHEAHHSRQSDKTGNEYGKDLPGLGDSDSHHGYLTPALHLPYSLVQVRNPGEE